MHPNPNEPTAAQLGLSGPMAWRLWVMRHCVWLPVGLGVCGIVMLTTVSCSSSRSQASNLQFEVTVQPSPPMVGDAEVSVKLTDSTGAMVPGAEVQVEGDMNHAGMKPSLADLREIEPGHYSGTLKFTMGGDWFLIVTAKTSDGKTAEHKIDVPGVKTQ